MKQHYLLFTYLCKSITLLLLYTQYVHPLLIADGLLFGLIGRIVNSRCLL